MQHNVCELVMAVLDEKNQEWSFTSRDSVFARWFCMTQTGEPTWLC